MKPRTFIRKDENGKEKVIAIQPRSKWLQFTTRDKATSK